MSLVLSLIIVGWLVAFSLGSQVGFDNDQAVVITQVSVTKTEKAKSATYREPISAS